MAGPKFFQAAKVFARRIGPVRGIGQVGRIPVIAPVSASVS
jgi:hypothetical protein